MDLLHVIELKMVNGNLLVGCIVGTIKKLSMIYNFGHNEIPRRDLTIELTKELKKTVDRILTEMLMESCPCHYPRLRF